MKRTVIAIAAAWMAFAAAVHAADLEFLFVGDDGSDAVVVPSLGTNLAVNAKLVCGGTNKVAGVFAKVACSGDLGLLSIGGESAAFNGNSVSTNISLSSAAVFNLDNGFDPACAIDGETAFQLKIDVPAGTTNGTYSVGFSELQVFKNGSGDRWTTSFRPLTVVVGTPSPSTYFDPTTRTTNTCDTSLLYTGQTTLNAGWYVVDGIVTNDARIVVSGDVNLILKDNAELTASAGINVDVNNNVTNSLTIWAQSDGANMGSLTATATFESGDAGIGGGYGGSSGTVTINGGKVTATGGNCAAGIGGGYSGTGGKVTINGGKVTATGGNLGAGIGVGLRGSDVAVTINGGKVEATGCPGGAGIGGGMEGSSVMVTVNGGEVTATCTDGGAGIGGGWEGSGVTVTVNGGQVTAQSRLNGAGIGGGYNGSGVTVTIAGGEVTATGGEGDGIGVAGCETVIKPAGGKMIAVAAGANAGSAVAVAGSPFAAETDVTSILADKHFVHVGKAFEAGDITLADYEGVYDGFAHTIGIATNAIEGLELRYAGRDASTTRPDGRFVETSLPEYVNVTNVIVWVEARAPGYVAFTTNATVKITKAPLTITAKDQTYRYNGLQQGESDTLYGDPDEIAGKVEVEGLKGADTLASIELDGQGTDAGTYPIEPSQASVANGGSTVTGNYAINYVNGTLTILGEAAVSNVVAASSEPWDGKVQIAFNVTNSPAACLPDWNMPFLSIVATDNVTGSNYVSMASALSGDTDTADGVHMVEWDFKAQGIEFYSTNVTFTVAYLKMPDWCVIDLSGGTNAVSYPVTYLAAEPDGGFTNDLYRTTNLVMRLIGPGTFEMGESGSTETTEITNAFYCAVFETTQRQWELVAGNRPSFFTNEPYYATRPVEKVSWNMIRGDANTYDWPNVQGVASDSFLGVLRQKTDLDALDLPTEAQWEYACRAGTTSTYNNGGDTEDDLRVLGRYWGNGGQGSNGDSSTDNGTAAVGSYDPNKWGLYDMHGNVWEWCLERYSSSESYWVMRGGSWNNNAFGCTSSYRYFNYPSDENYYYGFRLVRTLSNDFESERSTEAVAGAERAGTVCSGASEPITVGKKPAAELTAELKWKHLKATGTYFAQLKLTCTNWLDSGISDLKFMFADRVGADGKTSAALWSTPLRSANTNVEASAGTTYRCVALDESLIEEENTPVVYGVADLSATAIPVAERTIEMYVRTGVAPEGQNAASAQVDDFVGYVCWTSSDEACAVPVVASGVNAGHMFGAVRPLAGASLPSPKTLNESLALGVPVVERLSPYCRVTEFSVDGERIKGRIEVGAGENVGSLGANATVTVLGAASPAGPFETLGAVETEEDGSFSLVSPEDAQFFKLRIDVKEVVR